MLVTSTIYKPVPSADLYDTLQPTELLKAVKAYPKNYTIVTTGAALPVIANQLYGDSEYWIFLAEYNNLIDPVVTPSTLYIIPKVELVQIISEHK